MHVQPEIQSSSELQKPRQTTPVALLCNWLAETAPAHSTEAKMVVNSAFLASFLNIVRTPFACQNIPYFPDLPRKYSRRSLPFTLSSRFLARGLAKSAARFILSIVRSAVL